MSYLWSVIIYLFDYFVNYLSIELLIHPHDKLWIMHDLIWDYCIQMHIVAVRDRVRTWKLNLLPRPFCLHLTQKLRQVSARTSASYQHNSHCIYLTARHLLWPFAHLMCVCLCEWNCKSHALFVRGEEGFHKYLLFQIKRTKSVSLEAQSLSWTACGESELRSAVKHWPVTHLTL